MPPDTLHILGYASSFLIGISLGLIGGGGSILTVPVLVYLLGVEPVMATAYSLFIVGLSSLVGAFPKYREGLVDLRTAAVFGIPSIAAVFVTRSLIVPAIPETIGRLGEVTVTRGVLMLLLFATLMVAASISMIRNGRPRSEEASPADRVFNYPMILLEGAVVGVLTGLVGAGGGFLIIPALVLLSGLPMKQAVGTSLLIIAAKSLIGFLADATRYAMDWRLLSIVTAIAMAGILAGNRVSRRIDGDRLKTGFGWFVLVMGLYILVREGLMGGGGSH
jgi:uncharacterized membrane protein YfcA